MSVTTSTTRWTLSVFLADVIVPSLSNSLEALALAAAVLVALCRPSVRPTMRAFALGAIISLGVFIRFTFILFALPLALHVVASGRGVFGGVATAVSGLTAAAATALLLVGPGRYYSPCHPTRVDLSGIP